MMQFSLKHTIRGRLLLLAIGVEAMMLTILVSNSLRLLQGAMTNQAHMQVQVYSPVLVAALTAPLAQRDYATVQAIITESQQSGGINYIVVADRTGKRVGSSGWNIDKPLPEPVKELPLFEKKNKMRYDVLDPLSLNNQPLGSLQYGLDLSHIISARRVLLTQGLSIAAVEIVLSSLMMMFIGYWLTRHLTSLTKASLLVAAGNLSPPAVPEGTDDIGQLGAAFNAMSRAIAHRVGELSKLSTAVEHSPVSIVITDRQGKIEYVNQKFCQLTGYSSDEVIGQNSSILKSGEHSQEYYKKMWETIQAGEDWRGEFHNRKKDGNLFWELALISPIRDNSGIITHFVAIKENIGAQKQLQEELSKAAEHDKLARERAEQASRTKSDFLASMSHEIRTPLNAILGMTDLLVETEINSEQAEYLAVVRSAGETLQGLIDNILDLSKIEAGMLLFDEVLFNLPESIQQLMGMMSVRAFQKNISLTTSLTAGVPDWLVGDSFRLGQILLNLIGNAIKFTEKGTVSLKVETVSASDTKIIVRFSVTDTGIGIPADKVQTVFDVFSQADSSTTRKYGGSGLGLSISRRLIEMMGGTIGVESTPGAGSCFSFTCCFGAPSETPIAKPENTVKKNRTIRPLSILLVDDNQDNRTVLKAYFRKTEHTIEIAVNGEEAVTTIKQGDFDLVLMDMEMPVMDGYTAVCLIREWEQENGRSPLPIIALTANALKEDHKKSLDAGCTDHLTKPIHKERLLEVVGHYADEREHPLSQEI